MKTFENSYNPNAENSYGKVDFNTEQPTIESTKKTRELTALEKNIDMQMENEVEKLEKVISQLPEKERKGLSEEVIKKIKATALVVVALTAFAAAESPEKVEANETINRSVNQSAGRVIQESTKGVGKELSEIVVAPLRKVERWVNGGMTEQERKQYNKKLTQYQEMYDKQLTRYQKARDKELSSKNAGVRARALENYETKKNELKDQYETKKNELKDQYGIE